MLEDATRALRKRAAKMFGLQGAWYDGFWKGALSGLATSAALLLIYRAVKNREPQLKSPPYAAM